MVNFEMDEFDKMFGFSDIKWRIFKHFNAWEWIYIKHLKMQPEAWFDQLTWWYAFMSLNFQMLDFLPMKLLKFKSSI
jgi:hypothetical protein